MMPPFQVELSEDDYLALLKSAVKGAPLTRRLVVAPEVASRGRYLFRGSRAEGLLLRALALDAAPGAVRAIDRALAAAEKAEKR